MIELSNRLGQIARMVQPGSVVADIGTDHGQLMVYLAQNGTIRRGYACDINEKPLNKARQIIADYGLEDRIECVLASGLDGLQPGSVDTVVIAGMGGDLTARILDAAPWVREYHTRLLAAHDQTGSSAGVSLSGGLPAGTGKRSDQRQICLYRIFCGL